MKYFKLGSDYYIMFVKDIPNYEPKLYVEYMLKDVITFAFVCTKKEIDKINNKVSNKI